VELKRLVFLEREREGEINEFYWVKCKTHFFLTGHKLRWGFDWEKFKSTKKRENQKKRKKKKVVAFFLFL
jgi:hypothetical protein